MALELFGWKILRDKEVARSPIPKIDDDGALVLEKNYVSGGADAYAVTANFDTAVANETALITKYREIAQVPELDFAIDDIVNEMMSVEKDNDIVEIDVDNLPYSDGIKSKITKEFDHILNVLDFNNSAYEIARRWYEDGRLNYHVIVDEKTAKTVGITELRYIDPRTIRKIREVNQERGRADAVLQRVSDEYFIYSPDGFAGRAGAAYTNQALKIAADSIVHVTSGLMNHNNTMVLSYLHKAIRPLNLLRAMEDSTVIYRLTRAPERRIFYIDVGNLPKAQAEQHLKSIATQYKNKLVYDQVTGEIRDDRKFMTMQEDFFLPRRSDGKATEITTLPGGQNLGEMEEVTFFLNKLYRALNVPLTRLDNQSTFQFGRQTEISRDEVKFAKFIARLRKRFSHLFIELLQRQLILKGIMSAEEFEKIRNKISFEFSADNLFAEHKEMEILNYRFDILERADTWKGIYLSKEFIRRNILRMSQEDIKEMDDEMAKEKDSMEYDEDNQLKLANSGTITPDDTGSLVPTNSLNQNIPDPEIETTQKKTVLKKL